MKNFKKAQIGSTMTWFSGFLVIFFIMIMFLMFTLVAASHKTTSKDFLQKNLVSEKVVQQDNFLQIQGYLQSSYNSIEILEIINNLVISDKSEDKNLLVASFMDFYRVSEIKCRYFDIDYNGKKIYINQGYTSPSNPITPSYGSSYSYLNFYLVSSDLKEIKLIFYGVGC